jgi:hypothetical protein
MEFSGTSIKALHLSVPGDEAYLAPFGDLHYGNPGFVEHKASEAIAEGVRKRALFLLMGDLVDAVYVDDKRWSPADADGKKLDDLIPDQFKAAARILAPAKGRIIGALKGNHEHRWIARHGVESVWRLFCESIGAPSLGMSTIFDLHIWYNDANSRKRASGKAADRVVRVAAHHGTGGGRTLAGKLASGIRWSDGVWGCDVILWAHTHMMSGVCDPKIGGNEDCSEAKAHNPVIVWTGGFLGTYHAGSIGYGEENAYRAVALGAPLVRIEPNRIRVEVG